MKSFHEGGQGAQPLEDFLVIQEVLQRRGVQGAQPLAKNFDSKPIHTIDFAGARWSPSLLPVVQFLTPCISPRPSWLWRVLCTVSSRFCHLWHNLYPPRSRASGPWCVVCDQRHANFAALHIKNLSRRALRARLRFFKNRFLPL